MEEQNFTEPNICQYYHMYLQDGGGGGFFFQQKVSKHFGKVETYKK